MNNKKRLLIIISVILVVSALVVLGITIGNSFNKKYFSNAFKGVNEPDNLGDDTGTSSTRPNITCESPIYEGETGSCSINNGSLTGSVTSSDKAIAFVQSTGSGSFTIKGEASGTVTFTAIVNGQSVTSNQVTVKANTVKVSSISVTCTPNNITVGSRASCSATVSPPNATSKNVTWSISDTSIAVVNQSGNVTPRNLGTVVVTATSSTDSKKYGNFTINIIPEIEGEKVIAIAADIGTVTSPYKEKYDMKVDWGASGASATFTGCSNTATCEVTFSHQGVSSGSYTVTDAKVTATYGTVSKDYDVTVYSYCAWKLVDSNKGPYSDIEYSSLKIGDRDSMRFVKGCDAYEEWYKKNDEWYYTNHYNRCCGTGGGGVTPTPTYSCYVNEITNDYQWSTSSPGDGYSVDSSIDSPDECKKPVCYVNETTGDYKWSSTSPGSGYTINSSITKESDCTKPVTPTYSCYVNETTNDYQWSSTSPGSGYTINSNITDEKDCVKPEQEKPACYIDVNNNYVWGLHQNDNNYTLVENVGEEECTNVIEVPITDRNVATIIYAFVVILLGVGIWFIYYVNHKKKLS